MHERIIEMNIPAQAERFLMQKMANLSDALGEWARNIVGQRHAHWNTAAKSVEQDGVDIFRGSENKAQRCRMARTVIAETIEIALVHKQKQLSGSQPITDGPHRETGTRHPHHQTPHAFRGRPR